METVGDYIVTFASMLFGLAMGDILLDFNRLLSRRLHVRWHALPLIAALYVILILLSAWWDLFHWANGMQAITIIAFIPMLFKLSLIFLIAAAVLPSDPEEGYDLKAYYFDNRRRLYGLFFLLGTFIVLMPFIEGRPFNLGFLFLPLRTMVISAILFWTARPWIHWLLLPLMFASFAYFWFGAMIG